MRRWREHRSRSISWRGWQGRSRTSAISRSRCRWRRQNSAISSPPAATAFKAPGSEEAITLMTDLDAGATGAMTGGGYPDGIRQIMDPYFAGRREEAVAAYARWLPLINMKTANADCKPARS